MLWALVGDILVGLRGRLRGLKIIPSCMSPTKTQKLTQHGPEVAAYRGGMGVRGAGRT